MDSPNDGRPLDNRTARKEKMALSLEELPETFRFAVDGFGIQASQYIQHGRGDSSMPRFLRANEIATQALNELAAQEGYGFFQHLRDRTWGRPAPEGRFPSSRRHPEPGAEYPNIVFSRYRWDEGVHLASPRWRYLSSDFLMNTPHPDTPLYCIQYISCRSDPVFASPTAGLVVIQGQETFYLCDSVELEQVLGRHRQRRKLGGADKELRLASLERIWQAGREGDELRARFEEHKQPTLHGLYREILRRCRPGSMRSTSTVEGILGTMPKPKAPEAGLPLGSIPGP